MTTTDKGALVEGEDFYREGALVVFTARFLLRRGYCCGSGCRHCPYDVGGSHEGTGEDERDAEGSEAVDASRRVS
jgi:hypothetical protein